MRLFVGIPLADAVTSELSALVSRLRPAAGNLRWSAPQSWHITLQFLGNASPEQLECLTTRLGNVRCAPVGIELGELGSFERSGVLIVDVIVAPPLAALQERVVAATSLCGFGAETRPFHPHITLARKSGTGATRKQGNADIGTKGTGRHGNRDLRPNSARLRDLALTAGAYRFSRFTAHEFLLYDSHLSSEHSRYEVRGQFPLSP
jgi:RNA 2',3'-cyclic 3'-phosphodiesterase